MKYFDFNCMLGPTNTNREPSFQTADALLAEMDRLDIAEALVYSSLSRYSHPSDGNAHILEAVRGHERLHPCWVLMPPGTNEMPPPDELVQQMQAAGVRAARMFPVQHRYPFLERSCRPLLQALAAAKIPLLLDSSRRSWTEITLDWREIFDVAERHPDLPLILVREGGSTARVLFSVWNELPNIKLDASYIQESRIVDHIVERFGSDKLMFGTGMPHYDAGGPIASIQGAGVDKTARADMAGNNARRLLGLPVAEDETIRPWPCGKDGFRVFDIHGHIGHWETKYYPDATAAQMVERMDYLGIERFTVSDIMAIGPDYRAGNDRIGRSVAEFPDRIVGYAVYNPNYESEMKAEMARCFDELGCRGIKLHCATHDMSTEDPSYRLAFETAQERSCPILCHVHEGPSPEFLKQRLAEFPDAKFIFAHLGGCDKNQLRTFIDTTCESPNLFLDTGVSMNERGSLTWLAQRVPIEQILYGSDHPLNEFAFQLGRVLYADIDDASKRKILWDNAARIFNLS